MGMGVQDYMIRYITQNFDQKPMNLRYPLWVQQGRKVWGSTKIHEFWDSHLLIVWKVATGQTFQWKKHWETKPDYSEEKRWEGEKLFCIGFHLLK